MKPKPIYEVDELRTAHDVRRIRQCVHCDGAGFGDSMVHIGLDSNPKRVSGVRGASYHPQCYLAAYGFRSVTQLPLSQRDKYRMKDLNVRQMRRILDLRRAVQLSDNPKE
jgi:hypothetical protein